MNKKALDKIVGFLNSQPIERAWLFGSYARNQEDETSDIDLLVCFSPDSKITLFKKPFKFLFRLFFSQITLFFAE